jgi:hypothetical protein
VAGRHTRPRPHAHAEGHSHAHTWLVHGDLAARGAVGAKSEGRPSLRQANQAPHHGGRRSQWLPVPRKDPGRPQTGAIASLQVYTYRRQRSLPERAKRRRHDRCSLPTAAWRLARGCGAAEPRKRVCRGWFVADSSHALHLNRAQSISNNKQCMGTVAAADESRRGQLLRSPPTTLPPPARLHPCPPPPLHPAPPPPPQPGSTSGLPPPLHPCPPTTIPLTLPALLARLTGPGAARTLWHAASSAQRGKQQPRPARRWALGRSWPGGSGRV